MGALIDSLDAFELAFMQAATLECKSVLMAVALLAGRISFTEATLLSRMEEEFQVSADSAVSVTLQP
jgi:chaperone required for assembly of F1-ATPase